MDIAMRELAGCYETILFKGKKKYVAIANGTLLNLMSVMVRIWYTRYLGMFLWLNFNYFFRVVIFD